MAPHIFEKGVEGKRDSSGQAVLDKDGNAIRPGCKFVVVFQPDVSDDPLPYFHAANEADAKEYVKKMRECGQGKGLRVVPAGKNGGDA